MDTKGIAGRKNTGGGGGGGKSAENTKIGKSMLNVLCCIFWVI